MGASASETADAVPEAVQSDAGIVPISLGSSASGTADAVPDARKSVASSASSNQAKVVGECGSGPGHLDENAFQQFAPLLAATQDYAVHSGCRFRSSSFSDLPTDEAACTSAVGEAETAHRGACDARDDVVDRQHSHHVAKLRSAPTVFAFRERLQAGDPELHEELVSAMRIVMAESVRNAMIAAFRELEMWPPSPHPAGVADDDCNYEDVSAPIPVIALRTYHDEAQRRADTPQGDDAAGAPQHGRMLRRAMTASFLIDFATEAGAPIPPTPESHLNTLKEFSTRLGEYEQDQMARNAASAAFIGGFGVGAENGEEAAGWFSSAQNVAWDAVSGIFVGVAHNAGIDLVRRGSDKEISDPDLLGDLGLSASEDGASSADPSSAQLAPCPQAPTSAVWADVFQCAMRPNKVGRLQSFSIGGSAPERGGAPFTPPTYAPPDRGEAPFTPSTCSPPSSTTDSSSTLASQSAP